MWNPNLYASLDMIPVIDMNGSKSRPNRTQNGLLQHHISPNGPKWSETVKKYRKWVKISKRFLENSEKLKFSYHFENSPSIVHLHLEFQELIPRASSDEITSHLVKVFPHALLFHLHAIFFYFNGQIFCLGHPKVCVSVHIKIGSFSAYRDGYMQKTPWYPCTYTVVLQTVV